MSPVTVLKCGLVLSISKDVDIPSSGRVLVNGKSVSDELVSLLLPSVLIP